MFILMNTKGLIRRFKHVLEERLENPEKYQQEKEKYFQTAWSGKGSQMINKKNDDYFENG